jgi:outer membrane protein assembly factor BamB
MRAALFFGALLAGCATLTDAERGNDRVNPEVPLWVHHPSGSMDVYIRRELTAWSRSSDDVAERGKPEIDPEHGRVFVGSSDHGLYALRATNGSTLWRFETIGMVQSEPLYDATLDVVYFGSHDGALYAVQARDGKLVWRFDCAAEVTRKPVLFGETLIFANAADQLFAIDRRTGKTRWTAHRTPALGMEIQGYAGPALDGHMVYIAYSDGHVAAYEASDGTEKWSIDLSAEGEHVMGETQRYLDVDTTPVVADVPQGHVVFVASYENGLFELDAESGTRLYGDQAIKGVTDLVMFREPEHAPHPEGSYKGTARIPARQILLASSASTGLWAVDPASRRVLWRNPVPEGGITAPTQVAGAIAVGTTRYGLFLIHPLTGRAIDVVDLGTGFSATPSGYGNRLFALSNGGTFLGIGIDHPLGARK